MLAPMGMADSGICKKFIEKQYLKSNQNICDLESIISKNRTVVF